MAGEQLKYDVVVVGGGTGGIGAAVGAAMCGARVLLVERYGFLGGAATGANVLAFCGFYTSGSEPFNTVGGVGQLILDELNELGSVGKPIPSPQSNNWTVPFSAETAKLAFDRAILSAGVDLRLHSRLVDVVRTDRSIKSIQVFDHSGVNEILASAFIDASGDANLTYLANAGAYSPRETGTEPQLASMPILVGGVSKNCHIDRKLLRSILSEFNEESDKENIRMDGGFIDRRPLTEDIWWIVINLPTDGLTSESMTRAEIQGRELAWRNIQILKKHMPGFENAYLSSTGSQIGIRESRHVKTRTSITEDDVRKGRKRKDKVACGCWPLEIHRSSLPDVEDIAGNGWFDIPYGSIYSEKLDNLWLAGRTIGCDNKAYSSIRVMGTALATGHAAGVAAAEFVNSNIVDIASVQQKLRSQEAILEPSPAAI